MKSIIIFCLILFAVGSYAQVINFPDPVFKTVLLGAGVQSFIATDADGNSLTIDANGDQEIDREEALQVYELDLQNSELIPALNIITDVAGIEYFTNLTRLWLGYNDLLVLDVSALSNLESLTSDNNPRLHTINVSGLVKLKTLNSVNCGLTFLDLSGLPLLRTLVVHDNRITDLNFVDTENIELLVCGNNLLQEIDLSDFQRLSSFLCHSNLLTSLNLYGKTTLHNLLCANNNLITVNIKNTGITNSSVFNFNGNPNLEYICTNTSIVENVRQKALSYGYTNCGVNDACDLATTEFNNATFTIFPNPANDRLTILSSENALIQSVVIYNVLGQPVFSKNEAGLSILDVSSLKTGNYFIKINSDKGTTHAKFVKK